jgi:hypothetical protein
MFLALVRPDLVEYEYLVLVINVYHMVQESPYSEVVELMLLFTTLGFLIIPFINDHSEALAVEELETVLNLLSLRLIE